MAKSIRLRYAGSCSVCSAELARGTEAWWDAGAKTAWCAAHGESAAASADAVTPESTSPPRAEPRRLKARYTGRCSRCQTEIPAKTEALWIAQTKTLTCLACGDPTPAPTGGVSVAATRSAPRADDILGTQGGGSALAKYQEKKAAEEERVREAWGRFPRLANLIIKVTEESQDTAAWGKGGRAERALSSKLGEVPGVRVLHDRLRPGSKTANIDHLAVAPTGVWVIDAKAYSGKLELRNRGTFFRPNHQLFVNGRRQDRLVEGVLKQADAVKTVLAPTHGEVPVWPVLCFIGVEMDLFESPFQHQGAVITWPRRLYKSLAKPGPLGSAEIEAVHLTLSRSLRAAVTH